MQSQNQCVRILHVEDDPRDAELFRARLEQSGIACAITVAKSHREFSEALEQGSVDLVVSDSGLPNFDPLKALALLREIRPDIPFVFFTGNTSPKLKAEALAHGATHYLSKDQPEEFIEAVKQIWRTRLGRPMKSAQNLPEVGKTVVARCAGFRCLAFRDHDGKWRDLYHKQELPDVIEWFED